MQHFWPGLAVTGRSRQKHFNSFDIFITQKLDNARLLASTDHLHYRNFNCTTERLQTQHRTPTPPHKTSKEETWHAEQIQ